MFMHSLVESRRQRERFDVLIAQDHAAFWTGDSIPVFGGDLSLEPAVETTATGVVVVLAGDTGGLLWEPPTCEVTITGGALLFRHACGEEGVCW